VHRFVTPIRAVVSTVLLAVLWVGLRFLSTFQSDYVTFPSAATVNYYGWILTYLLGLLGVIDLLERLSSRIETRRAIDERRAARDTTSKFRFARNRRLHDPRWNPFDPTAWYYMGYGLPLGLGVSTFVILFYVLLASFEEHENLKDTFFAFFAPETWRHLVSRDQIGVVAASLIGGFLIGITRGRLRQSLSILAAYSLLFLLVYLIAHWEFGKKDKQNSYELPPGSGRNSIKASMKVEEVEEIQLVVNQNSNININAPPPIDDYVKKTKVDSSHQYKAGSTDGSFGEGGGDDDGFGGGKEGGKIRFLRLSYGNKSCNRNAGPGGDKNLLIELGARVPKLKKKIAENTESVDHAFIANHKDKQYPPLVYICGTGTFALTPAEKKTFKNYLIEQHGMIFGDNLGGENNGGQLFQQSFINVMNELTGVTPVDIPRDDDIHQKPYELEKLPIVVAHGGTTAKGWKVDGRWAVYLHPGGIGDAWADGHSGLTKPYYDSCYELGINVISYAHVEHSKWRKSQSPSP